MIIAPCQPSTAQHEQLPEHAGGMHCGQLEPAHLPHRRSAARSYARAAASSLGPLYTSSRSAPMRARQ